MRQNPSLKESSNELEGDGKGPDKNVCDREVSNEYVGHCSKTMASDYKPKDGRVTNHGCQRHCSIIDAQEDNE